MNKLISGKDVKTKNKFKPRRKPRYLPGSVEYGIIRSDLREYNKHLYRIFDASPLVDNKAPQFHPAKYFRTMEMHNDFFNLKSIDRQNKELLKLINKINRTGGMVDTFNMYAYKNLSKWNFKKVELDQIRKDNKLIHKRLKEANSEYSKEKLDKEWKITARKIQHICKYPCDLFKQKSLDAELRNCASISDTVQPPYDGMERLKYFMEFQIENGLKLGKVVMELYYDFVPNVVDTFLKYCESDSFKNSRILKVYKDRYCVLGNLKKTYKNEEERKISYDNDHYLLKHSKAAALALVQKYDFIIPLYRSEQIKCLLFVGVISMVPANIKNWTGFMFHITFDKMPELDGKLIVIGKIIWGAVNLFKVNDFGSKFGYPSGNIIVSNCGKCIK